MVKLIGETSGAAVVALFGECGSIIGEPALAVAIDLRVSVKAQPAEYDFFVVDGYKMDPQGHSVFNAAVHRLWHKAPLEFSTSSQIPMVSGLGTHSALVVALTGLLINLNKNPDDNPKQKKKITPKKYLARQAFVVENSLPELVSPLGTSTSVAGGVVLMNDISTDALWSIKGQNRNWFIHHLEALDGTPLVIGYLDKSSKSKHSALHPRALFNKPVKFHRKKRLGSLGPSATQKINQESILTKLQRFIKRSGFAKDNIKEIGKITRSSVEALTTGDLAKVGNLMARQYNLMTILGVCPEELRPLVDAAKQDSYGVTITGTKGDAIVALSEKPEEVVMNIQETGGDAVITKVTQHGFK